MYSIEVAENTPKYALIIKKLCFSAMFWLKFCYGYIQIEYIFFTVFTYKDSAEQMYKLDF